MSVSVKFELDRSAPLNFAPSMSARYKIAPSRFASLKSALVRSARRRLARRRLAPSKFARVISERERSAPSRFAPARFVSFIDLPLRSTPARSIPDMSALSNIRYCSIYSSSGRPPFQIPKFSLSADHNFPLKLNKRLLKGRIENSSEDSRVSPVLMFLATKGTPVSLSSDNTSISQLPLNHLSPLFCQLPPRSCASGEVITS